MKVENNKLSIVEIAKDVLKDKELILEDLKDKIKISYKGKTAQPKPITLPKYVKLNEALGEFCGLYYGEGATSKNSWTSHTQFTNTDVGLVENFLSFVENHLDFDRKNFNYRIKASRKANENLSEEQIIRFWKNKLGLIHNPIIKVYWDKGIKTRSSHRMMVTLGSIIFRRTLDQIMDLVCELCFIHHRLRVGFIRGLFAGEGTVALNKESLHRAVISQGYKDPIQDKKFGIPKRNFIKKLLEYENIKTNNNKTGMNVIVTNLKNLEIFYNLKLYGLHKDKLKKFERGFIKLKKNKRAGISNYESQLLVLELLYNKGPMSISKISNLRNRHNKTIVGIVNGRKDINERVLLEKNYIHIPNKIKLKHSKKPINLYNITSEGKNYLKELKNKIY